MGPVISLINAIECLPSGIDSPVLSCLDENCQNGAAIDQLTSQQN